MGITHPPLSLGEMSRRIQVSTAASEEASEQEDILEHTTKSWMLSKIPVLCLWEIPALIPVTSLAITDSVTEYLQLILTWSHSLNQYYWLNHLCNSKRCIWRPSYCRFPHGMSEIHDSLRGQGETANLPSWQGDELVLPWISIDYPYKAVPQERCYRPYVAFLFFRLDRISENRCQRARKASAGLPVYFQIEAVVHLVRFPNLLLWSYDSRDWWTFGQCTQSFPQNCI